MRRFYIDHLLVINAIFNTNRHWIPLITSISITNKGHALPITFSYYPRETMESYTFFLKVVRGDILGESVPNFAIVLIEMSLGIISIVKSH
jgi:hypothetical protein